MLYIKLQKNLSTLINYFKELIDINESVIYINDESLFEANTYQIVVYDKYGTKEAIFNSYEAFSPHSIVETILKKPIYVYKIRWSVANYVHGEMKVGKIFDKKNKLIGILIEYPDIQSVQNFIVHLGFKVVEYDKYMHEMFIKYI